MKIIPYQGCDKGIESLIAFVSLWLNSQTWSLH